MILYPLPNPLFTALWKNNDRRNLTLTSHHDDTAASPQEWIRLPGTDAVCQPQVDCTGRYTRKREMTDGLCSTLGGKPSEEGREQCCSRWLGDWRRTHCSHPEPLFWHCCILALNDHHHDNHFYFYWHCRSPVQGDPDLDDREHHTGHVLAASSYSHGSPACHSDHNPASSGCPPGNCACQLDHFRNGDHDQAKTDDSFAPQVGEFPLKILDLEFWKSAENTAKLANKEILTWPQRSLDNVLAHCFEYPRREAHASENER